MKKNIIFTYIIVIALISSLVGLAAVTIESTIKTKLETRSTYLDSNSTYTSSFTIYNNGNSSIESTFNITIEPDTDSISILCKQDTHILSENPVIIINPNESTTINVTLTTDETLMPGEYDTILYVKAGAQESIVHINTEKVSEQEKESANNISYALIAVIIVLVIILIYLFTKPKKPQQSKNINKIDDKKTDDQNKNTKDNNDIDDDKDTNMFDMLK